MKSVHITTKVVSSKPVHGDTTLRDKVYQWLATGRSFSPGTPVSSTKKKLTATIYLKYRSTVTHEHDSEAHNP
jgi:hypothetical protein